MFDTANFERMMTDTNGPLAEVLTRTAEAITVAAQETVGIDRPEPRALQPPLYYGREALNGAPGPPYRRSGDLQASMRPSQPYLQGTVVVDVVADAVHRGFAYSHWLLQEGYLFVDLQAISA